MAPFWGLNIEVDPDCLVEEQDSLRYPSKRKEKLKELVTDRISELKGNIKRPNQKILNDPGVKHCLHKLHEDFVLIPAGKAAKNNSHLQEMLH